MIISVGPIILEPLKIGGKQYFCSSTKAESLLFSCNLFYFKSIEVAYKSQYSDSWVRVQSFVDITVFPVHSFMCRVILNTWLATWYQSVKLSLHNYKDIFYFCCKNRLNVKRAFTLSIYFCKHLSISGFWGAGVQRQNYDAEASTWAKGVTGQFTSTDSIKHGCQKYEANAGGHADGHSCCCKSLMVVWKPKK